MKKYYYLNKSNERFGPLTKDELKAQSISRETLVWFEGMNDWKPAELIEEIKDIFTVIPPPPPPPLTPPPAPVNTISSNIPKKKSKVGVFIMLVIIIAVAITAIILYNNKNNSSSYSSYSSASRNHSNYNQPQTYEEKVMSVEETERANPTRFLKTGGSYVPNLWGDKFTITGNIRNLATKAKFKDIVIEVIYYSNTNTELRRKQFTVFQYIKPGQTITFEKKIDKPGKSFKKLGWNVISATPE